jgi:hypothetical protein
VALKLKWIIGELMAVVSAAFHRENKAFRQSALFAYRFEGTESLPLTTELPNCCSISLTFASNIPFLISLYAILELSIVTRPFAVIYATELPARIIFRPSSFTNNIESFSERITAKAAITMI